jgi:hypothetical protein
MKSVIIYGKNGKKLIHVKKMKNGKYELLTLSNIGKIDVVVLGNDNKRIMWKGVD